MMRWIHNFQLFLFDLDGLLVNTEPLHYEAYIQMCRNRGFDLTWSFPRYCLSAHRGSTTLRDHIYAEFPQLQEMEPRWEVLYAEKMAALINILRKGEFNLLPGATELLLALKEANIKRCVVTHSKRELVEIIRGQHAVLNTIPTWFSREDYTHPKPAPDGYLKAISSLATSTDKVIGFEDSVRGLTALRGTRAQPVIVCCKTVPELPSLLQEGVWHYESLSDVTAQPSFNK